MSDDALRFRKQAEQATEQAAKCVSSLEEGDARRMEPVKMRLTAALARNLSLTGVDLGARGNAKNWVVRYWAPFLRA